MPDVSGDVIKFKLNDSLGMQQYYRDNGYVVIEGLLPERKIGSFMDEYEKIKRSHAFVYYAQSTHRSIRPTTNEHGFIRESMQNSSRLGLYPRFAASVKDCIYGEEISLALRALDGHRQHVSWQDMFFDMSVGTIDHADSWYLDTDPPGALVAAWFALEDLDERAGLFYLMPGSHRIAPLKRADYPSHEAFRKATLKTIADHGFEPHRMKLDRGDVILWHPFTVHGSFANQDARFSRKSFTSHYFPLGAKCSYKGKVNVEATSNPAMYRIRRGSDVLANVFYYGRFAIDSVNPRAKMDMRRESYS